MRYLPLLILAGCGDDVGRAVPDARAADARRTDAPAADAPPIDAPPIDAPPIDAPPTVAGVERLDWRTVRGAPIATSAVTLPSASLFSVSGGGFAASRCQSPPGCAFTWYDLSGTPGTQRDHMARVTTIAISPDGRQTQLVALDAIETCNDGQSIFQVSRGTLRLLDLATGAASFELPLRTNVIGVQGFTPLSDWLFTSPISGTACGSTTTEYRSTTSPFAPPQGLDATDQFVQQVDARHWLVARRVNNRDDFGVADPLTSGSFQSLAGGDPDPFFDLTQRWVHVYQGFADLVRTVVSIPPTGPLRQTTVVSDQDWHSFGARGRWIRVCGLPKPSGAENFRDCRVIDAQGELAPVDFRIIFALSRADDAVLLNSGAIVFVGPTDDGSPAVQRLAFATGRREILHAGDGALQSLGDGAGALLLQSGSAWLIEAAHEELVADKVSQVVTVPQPLARALGRSPGRQDDLAVLVSSTSPGRFTLAILDVRTRRLATVTDNLYFTGQPGGPFSFDDHCGQPWTTRNGGTVPEGLFQQPQQLFFVEQGTPATLWLLPIDLSAPPRRLAPLGSPALCHSPLASPDGRRVGFAEDSADGTTARITLSSDN
jgi:hypothetical protein